MERAAPERYDDVMSEEYYAALCSRDGRYDGVFYYGVRTTGVYCRPVCKSRRPLPHNVEFFTDPGAARAAGYRACKRCRPDRETAGIDERFVRVCRAIEEAEEAPRLAALAQLVGMSPAHLQRAFKAAVGVSPRTYAAHVRERRFRTGLRRGASVTSALYDAGFGSASQLYGSQRLGMSPSAFRRGAAATRIAYAIVPTALGEVLVAATPRGVCRVDLDAEAATLERRLREEYPKAELVRADEGLASTTSLLVAYLAGAQPWPRLPLDVRATAFQSRVWDALRALEPGTTTSYGELARALGDPNAVRAVARACASNPVALLIPCHRVLGKSGASTGYRWGLERKRKLLALERDAV